VCVTSCLLLLCVGSCGSCGSQQSPTAPPLKVALIGGFLSLLLSDSALEFVGTRPEALYLLTGIPRSFDCFHWFVCLFLFFDLLLSPPFTCLFFMSSPPGDFNFPSVPPLPEGDTELNRGPSAQGYNSSNSGSPPSYYADSTTAPPPGWGAFSSDPPRSEFPFSALPGVSSNRSRGMSPPRYITEQPAANDMPPCPDPPFVVFSDKDIITYEAWNRLHVRLWTLFDEYRKSSAFFDYLFSNESNIFPSP